MDIEEIIDDVRQTLGSLRTPRFSLLSRRLADGPDAGLAGPLHERFEVTDETDSNNDHGWFLHLEENGSEWLVMLSAVSLRCATFVRLRDRIWEVALTPHSANLTPAEVRVIELLTGHGLELLTEKDLERPVPLVLPDNEDVRLYHALFVAFGVLPWENPPLT